MIRTVVVDDEPWARANLRVLLASDTDIELIAECGSGREAIEIIQNQQPDLVFLDVQMPECDGFEVMETLGNSVSAATVFVTAYDQYALKAFEVAAVDYLLKPFDNQRFFRALARAKEFISRRGTQPDIPHRLIVRNAGRVAFVPVSEIEWIEASDYCVSLHANARTYVLRRSLNELENDLRIAGFSRVHRSAIVNLACVREIRTGVNGTEEILLTTGARVRLSKGYRTQFRARLEALASS